MKLNAQTPKQSLNKAFLKQPVARDDIESFKTNLQTLLSKINEKESEEHHKNFVRDFLKGTFYKSDYEINTKGRQIFQTLKAMLFSLEFFFSSLLLSA